MIIHPRYLFGAVEPSLYDSYKLRNRVRALGSYKAMTEMMIKNQLVKIKEHPPYPPELERPVLLNSLSRTTYDPKTGEYSFKGKPPTDVPFDTANAKAVANALSQTSESPLGVGVDQELISSVPSYNPTFVERNFTADEIAYCRAQPSPPSSFAARWVGKEAVFKSLGVKSKGAAAAMKEIEILNDETGAPTVRLHGEAKSKADEKGISKVLISLSHSETVAIAFAQAS